MPESYNVWIQYFVKKDNGFDNAFQGLVSAVSVPHFSRMPANQTLHYPDHQLDGYTVLTSLNGSKNSQQLILHPQAQEYAVAIPQIA